MKKRKKNKKREREQLQHIPRGKPNKYIQLNKPQPSSHENKAPPPLSQQMQAEEPSNKEKGQSQEPRDHPEHSKISNRNPNLSFQKYIIKHMKYKHKQHPRKEP